MLLCSGRAVAGAPLPKAATTSNASDSPSITHEVSLGVLAAAPPRCDEEEDYCNCSCGCDTKLVTGKSTCPLCTDRRFFDYPFYSIFQASQHMQTRSCQSASRFPTLNEVQEEHTLTNPIVKRAETGVVLSACIPYYSETKRLSCYQVVENLAKD